MIGAAVFSIILSGVTMERTERRLLPGARAQHLRNHVILAGVGELGYRISMLLKDAGIDYSAIDPTPDDRFIDAVKRHGPVLVGDIRLDETLKNAGVERACALIACSPSNLSNVEACMRAEILGAEGMQTVARVFDDVPAQHAAEELHINKTFAAVDRAAPAFVDAAVDRAARRPFQLKMESDADDAQLTRRPPPVPMVGLRLDLAAGIDAGTLAYWRSRGIRMLAFRRTEARKRDTPLALTNVEPPSARPPGSEHVAMAVVGCPEVIEEFVRSMDGATIDGASDEAIPQLAPDRQVVTPA